MVLPRILTAIVGAPLVIIAIFAGGIPYLSLVTGIVILAIYEFFHLAGEGGYPNKNIMGIAGGILLVWSIYVSNTVISTKGAGQAVALIITVLLASTLISEMSRSDKDMSMLRIVTTISGVMLIAWPLGHLLLIRELHNSVGTPTFAGRYLTFFLFFVLWAQDISAWASGTWFGRHRIAPGISPKKTWEGTLCGLLCACITGWLVREIWLKNFMGRGEVIAISLLIGLVGLFSDLAESFIKRCFGAKDSSHILPGHGGILDRFDSFLFSAPVFYYYLLFTGKYY